MSLIMDDYATLFEIKIRGVCAAAFIASDTDPSPHQWEMLKGECEITMRELGEIGYATGRNFKVDLYRRETLPDEDA